MAQGNTPKRRPDLDTVYTINPDGSRNALHPGDVSGRWQVRLKIVWSILVAIYVGLPWLVIGGNPAVLIDLPARKAYLFGQTFTNQDFFLTFFLLTGLGFALFATTALFGRIWCGFACPQTVFLEGLIRPIERFFEGRKGDRLRRSREGWTFDRAWRSGAKHLAFLVVAYVAAHLFLAYFIPIRELLHVVRDNPANHRVIFGWTMFFTTILFVDFSWFREQTCLILCPYGRLQSALIDDDTIIVGYDEKRGEPRSKATEEGGDCVDCFRCVDVCPTGIDIRNGLQMECLGCTRCIDACDDIMHRIGRPEGLIRYDSQRAFETGERAGLLRPRTYLYTAMALIGLAVAGFSMAGRESFQANALRARGLPYTLEGERVQNLYTLHLQNKQDRPVTLIISGQEDDSPVELLIPQPEVRLAPLGDLEVPVFAYAERKDFTVAFPLVMTVTDQDSGESTEVEVTFRGPR